MPDSKLSKSCPETKDLEQMNFSLPRIRSEKVRYFLTMLVGAIAEELGVKKGR
jgi:hypothetical protein